ncbi:MAG: hypothetical protein QNJ63_29550 [Calothrix sp. MO_192.B10]|nr:hypothetical protein [Calothrix sp. MO_192.B10]
MRSVLNYWQINCYPPPCYLHEVKQSEDAANLPRNSSRHQIKDFGVGLLAVFVEFSEATDQWLVTVGFSLSETKEESTSLIMPSKRSLALSCRYKVVEIDAATGKPVSMKIRAI